MKYIFLLTVSLSFSMYDYSQLNFNLKDVGSQYRLAKEYVFNKQYTLAYPLLTELENNYKYNISTRELLIKQDIDYYYIQTGLLLNLQIASQQAIMFINDINNQQRATSIAFYLGHYYFLNSDFTKAISFFELAGYNDLGNEEIASLKFELAYAYFYGKDYDKAKPLFDEIHQLPANKYYLQSNYYFGFISYHDKDFENALKSFNKVESLPEYSGIVPYYIAEIYYFKNRKEQALEYALKGMGNPRQFYKKELQLLAGQIYFENKQYEKAMPLLEKYVSDTEKIIKEIVYELSFCYYSLKNVDKAIIGFKELSSAEDSLGQNSMYLLGDIYLKTNQKSNARNAFQFCANNASNPVQQEISRFNYAKLSFELKYADIALSEIKKFITSYPNSTFAAESKEILVNLLANSNNFREALITYKSIEQPSSQLKKIYPRLLFGMATEYLNEQRISEAAESLHKILIDPYSVSIESFANFWIGEIEFRQEHYNEAIKYIQKYLLKGGSQGEANITAANYILGYSFLKNLNYKEAAIYFKQVTPTLKSGSNAMQQDAYLRTADCFFMVKDYNSAKNMYENIINKSLPSSDYALFQIAKISGINNPSEKIRLLNNLQTNYPSSDLTFDAYIEIANSYMSEEKFKEAIPYLTKIINSNSNPFKAMAYLKLGLSWYNLNDNDASLGNYQKLITEYPQSAESDLALVNMKAIYLEKGKPNDYISFLKKVGKSITISAADSLAYNAAELKYTTSDCANALLLFTNYLDQYPEGAFNNAAYFNRSECFSKNKDWKNAILGYEHVANSIPNKFSEKATLLAARVYYLELNDYAKAKDYFNKLKQIATNSDNQLEALRGLVRSYYQTKDFNNASKIARDLLLLKNISTDDRAIANLVLGKSLHAAKKYEEAIIAFKVVSLINRSVWGAEARYEIASTYYDLSNLPAAEKSAMDVIKINGSSDLWVAKSYILLGDIYFQQKDYFNAKATFQSVASNVLIPELKQEAQQKLDKIKVEEKANSKLIQ